MRRLLLGSVILFMALLVLSCEDDGDDPFSFGDDDDDATADDDDDDDDDTATDDDDDATDDDDDDDTVNYGCDENDSDPSRAIGCKLLRLVNQDRALFPEESGNAQPLMWDDEMYPVALGHSQDMCDNNFFDHYNLDGQSPFDRMDEGGVDYSSAGENIAYNPDWEDTQYRFMAECVCVQNHRSNCLNPSFTHVAIAAVFCDHTPEGMSGDYYYVTQNFRALPGEAYLDVPYCEVAENQNTYWSEPASTATVSDYFGLEEPGGGHYTTCDGEVPQAAPMTATTRYGVK